MSSLGLKRDSCGGEYHVFGRKAVFLGDNDNGLEKLLFLGATVLFLEENAVLWVKNRHYWENVSSSEEKCYFWETLPSLVGKGPMLERMLAFLGEKSIYV